jgi:hypothetical protein
VSDNIRHNTMGSDYGKVSGKFVTETSGAILLDFGTEEKPNKVWAPRSLCSCISKGPETETPRKVTLEIESWWIEKMDLEDES